MNNQIASCVLRLALIALPMISVVLTAVDLPVAGASAPRTVDEQNEQALRSALHRIEEQRRIEAIKKQWVQIGERWYPRPHRVHWQPKPSHVAAVHPFVIASLLLLGTAAVAIWSVDEVQTENLFRRR